MASMKFHGLIKKKQKQPFNNERHDLNITHKHVVLIGGGTGTSTLVAGLQNKPLKITALISVADSGGSTGRLRDEFGFQPVGDLRQPLTALAGKHNQEWIRKVLLYRFKKGKGLEGHNLGNLILTALQDMSGSTAEALAIATRLFHLHGEILPVTEQTVDLSITYTDGTTVVGEDHLNFGTDGRIVQSVSLVPRAPLYKKAAEALRAADLVVIGPGDYFGSLMPALVVEGLKQIFQDVHGKIVYVVNLMTRHNQTHEWTVSDHVRGIEEVLGKKVDHIVVNTGNIPKVLLQAYAQENEYPVVDDLQQDSRVVRSNLVSKENIIQPTADVLHRSLLRHDPATIANILMELL